MASFNFPPNNQNANFGLPPNILANAANAIYAMPPNMLKPNNININNQPSNNNQFPLNSNQKPKIIEEDIVSSARGYSGNKLLTPAPPILKMARSSFKPMRSKNTKLDEKHLVKCIATLDEHNGLCKKQIRIKSINMAPIRNPNMVIGGNSHLPTVNIPSMTSNQPTSIPTSSFGFGNFPSNNPGSFSLKGNTNFPGNNVNNNNSFLQNKLTPPLSIGDPNNNTNNFFLNTNSNTNTNFNMNNNNGIGNNNTLGFQSFQSNNSNNSNPLTQTFNPYNNPNNLALNGSNMNMNMGFNNSQPQYTNNNQPNSFFNNNNQFNNPNAFYNTNMPSNNIQYQFSNINQPPLPQTGLFSPINQNSVTIFDPKQNPNNVLAYNLINNLLNSPPPNQIFGNQLEPIMNNQDPAILLIDHLFGNTLYERVIVNSLINSDIFQSLPEQKKKQIQKNLSDAVKGKNTSKPQKLFQFGEQEEKPQMKKKQYTNRLFLQKQKPIFYRAPYLFQEVAEKQNFQSEIKGGYKNKHQFQVKGVSSTRNRFRRNLIDLDPEKQEQYTIGKKAFNQFRQNYKIFQKMVIKQIAVKQQELPFNDGNFLILPSFDKYNDMTAQELKKVSNFVIEKEQGIVKFKQPISLYRKKLSACVKIEQDEIQIIDREWMNKKCELTYRNFCRFKEASEIEKKKLKKKIQKWAKRNCMQNCSVDESTGDVTVQIIS